MENIVTWSLKQVFECLASRTKASEFEDDRSLNYRATSRLSISPPDRGHGSAPYIISLIGNIRYE